jgi:hypothetical protein
MTFDRIVQAIAAAGFSPRGGFHPEPGDGVPDAAPGTPTRTLVLIGHVGPEMWRRFSQERDPDKDLLDDWSRERLTAIGDALGARVFFPFDKPPLPFLRWAQRAESCYPSPIGIYIHPEYGLWHGYRGALAFGQSIEAPAATPRPSPCPSCLEKPCLATCPVGAFSERGYDVGACARHIASEAGRDCMERGCRARRACPVGRNYVYEPAQAAFHMRAFLRRRRELGQV